MKSWTNEERQSIHTILENEMAATLQVENVLQEPSFLQRVEASLWADGHPGTAVFLQSISQNSYEFRATRPDRAGHVVVSFAMEHKETTEATSELADSHAEVTINGQPINGGAAFSLGTPPSVPVTIERLANGDYCLIHPPGHEFAVVKGNSPTGQWIAKHFDPKKFTFTVTLQADLGIRIS